MTTAVDALAQQAGTLADAEHAAEGVDLDNFLLDVAGSKGLDINVADSITDGTIERTMDGANTLTVTVHDATRRLVRSGMFNHAIDVEVDKMWFRLVQVTKQSDDLTLVFEDRIVAYLRLHKTPRSMSRAKMTRAQFVRLLVREVKATKINFYSPEINKAQPIAAQTTTTSANRQKTRGKGIPLDATVKVKDVTGTRYTAHKSQIKIMNQLLDEADALGASLKPCVALIMAAMVENQFSNSNVINDPGSTSVGVLQAQFGKSNGVKGTVTRAQALDVTYMAQCFLKDPGFTTKGGAITLNKAHPTWTAGQIAQKIEGSAYPGRYDAVHDEALAIVNAYGAGKGTGGTTTKSYSKSYQFHRGQPDGPKNENTWDCAARLAQEVNWRRFVSGTTFYFVADKDLMDSAPIATISEDLEWVDFVDFDIDSGKPINEASVICRADRWAAPPGATVDVTGSGPADGKWLVWGISRGIFSTSATITLRQPEAVKKEPAAEVVQTSGSKDTKNSPAGTTVTIAPGANLPGKPMQAPILEFLNEVAKHTNEKIVVGTGTNHSKYTTSGNVSDHFGGNAADVEVGGDARTSTAASSKGDNIAVAALIVCGIDRTTALGWARAGYLDFGIASLHTWKGHRVQIGWKTLVGGDHYNHVHIGVV